MGTRRPARSHQKNSGVFFIRILLATSKLARSEKGQLLCDRPELRRVLLETIEDGVTPSRPP